MAEVQSIIDFLLIMLLLLIVVLIFLACKPWRLFCFARSRPIKAEDIESSLVSEETNLLRNQSNELPRDYDVEGTYTQNETHIQSPRTYGLIQKQRVRSESPHVVQGESLVLDIESDPSEDIAVGQTLKLPAVKLAELQKQSRQNIEINQSQEYINEDVSNQSSCLTLEVISGPSCGVRLSVQSTNTSRLPLTLGRVSPSKLLLKDSEVSGKHALVNWNLDKMKWDVTDMGSLNGTLLNFRPINHPDSSTTRNWGAPVELRNGDIITLGTTSKVSVDITSQNGYQIPFGVGMASDPMALRRGGKNLPMEDVCYYQWPLPGIDQFGLFGICDGHGGVEAARSASKLFPEKIASILSDSTKRERVLSRCDASDVLRDAFLQTEACMNHHYEGCTATVLLVWADGNKKFFAQCSNVGDSSCFMNVDGKHIKMTEDHKVSNHSERLRIEGTGEPLKDGETRLCGLNLARVLGDKFLKQQDSRLSSEPSISPVVHIDPSSRSFAILASDGLWDVMSMKKSTQLVLQMRGKHCTDEENSAEKIASFLLSEARAQRTKDNTSIIFLDFDITGFSCKIGS